MPLLNKSYAIFATFLTICMLLQTGCMSSLEKNEIRGDLVKSEHRTDSKHIEKRRFNIKSLSVEKKIVISFQKLIIKNKSKRKVYEKMQKSNSKVKSWTMVANKKANEQGFSVEGFVNKFIGVCIAPPFDVGLGIPYIIILENLEGEKKIGTIKTDWEPIDKMGKEFQPVVHTPIKVSIPELEYQKTFETNEKGRVSIPLEDISRFRLLKDGMTLKVSGTVGSKTCSREKHFSSETMTALIEKSSQPPKLAFDLDFHDKSGDQVLDAGEKGILTFHVSNQGQGDAYGVVLTIEPKQWIDGVQLPESKNIGRIEANESKDVKVEIKAKRSIPTSELSFRAKLKEEFGFDSSPKIVRIQTERFHRPELAVSDFGIDDRNQNAQIEPAEVVQITARIKNTGMGKAEDAKAKIDLGSNVFFAPESDREFHLGELTPGEAKDVSFSFLTNQRIESGEQIPVRILLKEDRADVENTSPLKLTMNAPQTRVEETVIAEKEPSSGEAAPKSSGSLSVEVDHNIPEGSFADSNDVALLIGNRHYTKQGVPDVDYAYRDVNVFKRYLEKTMGFERVFVVKDATQGDFNTWFGTEKSPQGRLHNLVRSQESRVFVYYVGHGAPGPQTHKNYFVPVDANPDYVESVGYPVSRFYKNLKKLSSRKLIVVLDACFSGKTQEGLLFQDVSPARLVGSKKQDVQLQEGVVLSSAKHDELSVWYPQKHHSLFTYYFLKGLRGPADRDGNNRITSGELMAYLSERVPHKAQMIANRSQNPVLHGDQDLVLTHLEN